MYFTCAFQEPLESLEMQTSVKMNKSSRHVYLLDIHKVDKATVLSPESIPLLFTRILNVVGLGLLRALVEALSRLKRCTLLVKGRWRNEKESQTVLVIAVILRHQEAKQALKLWAC